MAALNKIRHHANEIRHFMGEIKSNPFSRLRNMWHVYRETRTKPSSLSSYPYSVNIETTVLCNYKCPGCPSFQARRDIIGSQKNLLMDFDRYCALLEQLKGKTWRVDFTGQGESMLHPQIYEMIRFAVENDFFTRLETNGSILDIDKLERSGLHVLHFALDGFSQESYATYRHGGNFANVKENLEALAALKQRSGRPHVDVRFLVFRHNEHEIQETANFLNSLELEVNFEVPYLPHGFEKPQTQLQRWNLDVTAEAFNTWSSTLAEYVDYVPVPDSGTYRRRVMNRPFHGRCTAPWGGLYVRFDGTVLPCCLMAKEDGLSMGNIFQESFLDVWNGRSFQEFRQQMAVEPGSVSPCAECPINFE